MDNFSNFKPIRNQLYNFDREEIAFNLSRHLHEIEKLPIDQYKGLFPWRLLFLLRCGFEYSNQNYPLKSFSDKELLKLINLLYDFEDEDKDPVLHEGTIIGVQKFLRRLAFQQFWLQHDVGAWDVGRQIELFCNLPNENPIKQFIENSMSNVTLRDTLILLVAVWSWSRQNCNNFLFLGNVLFRNLNFSSDKILRFLNFFSLSPDAVKKYLQTHKQNIKNPYYQKEEISPFVRYPFLQKDNKYLIYSCRLLQRTISYCFYDEIKTCENGSLSEKFGTIFEKYVEKDLRTLNVPFLTEKDLQILFPNKKVTDFILPLDKITLFIEAKAIEMRPIVRANQNTEAIKKELKDSIIKGTIQGFSLINETSHNRDKVKEINYENFFLLIITYKDLYLGDGLAIWEEFLEESITPELIKKDINLNILSPERIVVMSINEFDQLIAILHKNVLVAEEIFSEMIRSNRNHLTRKYKFSQHLEKYSKNKLRHPFLDNLFDEFIDSIKYALTE